MRVLRILLFLTLTLGPLSLLPISEAHIVGARTQDDQGYRFQFRTDPPFAYTGEEVFLASSIRNASDDLDLSNAQASIIISRNGEVIESLEAIDVPFGDFVIPYQFDDDGLYSIKIQLDNVEGNPSTDFPLDVIAFRMGPIILVVGTLTAIVLAVFVMKRRSR